MNKQVANERPSIKHPEYSAAFIGTRPGNTDLEAGRPFVGHNGDLLVNLMSAYGFTRHSCLMGNVCQFGHSGSWQKEKSLELLDHDIRSADPNIVVLLGDHALRMAGVNRTVHSHRGSLFKCTDVDSPVYGRKCISSYHPEDVMRQWDWMPLLGFDIKRAREEAEKPDLVLPQRIYDTCLTAQELIDKLRAIPSGAVVGCDIEGGIAHGGISCISWSADPNYAFLYAPRNYNDDENVRILRTVGELMHRDDVGFVFQNSMYDIFSLRRCWHISVRNVCDDTMLGGWEIYSELPKALGTQVSIYTREPAYKWERKTDSVQMFHEYNCKDSCVTREIRDRHIEILSEPGNEQSKEHYQFLMDLLPPTYYIMERGIRYDTSKADELRSEILVKQGELKSTMVARAGVDFNPNSPKQMLDLLYKRLNFEPQYVKEKGRKTSKITADAGALLTLYKKYDSDLIYEILKWKQLDGKRKQLSGCDPDGRARGSYNPVGTKTGRYSVSKSPTDTGAALQTITKSNRVCYIADEDHWFFQCDLEGADGWTIAAHCASKGDFNMLDDYNHGVKPAQVVALMQLHGTSIARLSADKLKELIKQTIKDTDPATWGFLYFTCKRVQHGSNYGLGKRTMVDVILKDSWKYLDEPVLVAERDADKLQKLYMLRYQGVPQWQDWVKEQLRTKKALTSPSGHTRKFFGRPSNIGTIQGAYSHEPQNTTTHATDMALWNLWNDLDNRIADGGLFVEPLHQVHDAICGQFHKDNVERATRAIRSYFDNPITIAGQELVIPYEGEFGPSWGDMSVGSI